MPYKIKITGKYKYRSKIIINKKLFQKQFPDDTDKSLQTALTWEKTIREQFEVFDERFNIQHWFKLHAEYIEGTVIKKTFLKKEAVKKRFIKFAGADLPVEKLTQFITKNYINKQKKHRPGGAVNRDINELSSIFTWGKDTLPYWPDIKNPFVDIRPLPADKNPHAIPTLNDFWEILRNTDDRQNIAILLTVFYTAARPVEVFRLTINDLDLEFNQIRLWSRKGKHHDLKPRMANIPELLKTALQSWLNVRDSHNPGKINTIFLSLNPNNLGSKFADRRYFMNNLCKKSGVPAFGLYGLRHLRARIEYAKGRHMNDVQKLLGHARATTTLYYLSEYGEHGFAGSVNETPPDDIILKIKGE